MTCGAGTSGVGLPVACVIEISHADATPSATSRGRMGTPRG